MNLGEEERWGALNIHGMHIRSEAGSESGVVESYGGQGCARPAVEPPARLDGVGFRV